MTSETVSKTKKKLTDLEKVQDYMDNLEHPLKAEIEAVREIIKNANNKISERIKWNAPSYFINTKDDLVTFNPRPQKFIHLVFHHPQIVNIKSDLLEGTFKDRRMMFFANMEEIVAKKPELERIVNELVAAVDEKLTVDN